MRDMLHRMDNVAFSMVGTVSRGACPTALGDDKVPFDMLHEKLSPPSKPLFNSIPFLFFSSLTVIAGD